MFYNINVQVEKLFFFIVAGEETKQGFPGACIIELITSVIYGFRNKLECLSLQTFPA
jgi:hypothetical protein